MLFVITKGVNDSFIDQKYYLKKELDVYSDVSIRHCPFSVYIEIAVYCGKGNSVRHSFFTDPHCFYLYKADDFI